MTVSEDCLFYYPVRLAPKAENCDWGSRTLLAWDDGAGGQACADFTGENVHEGFGALIRKRSDEALCTMSSPAIFPIRLESIATGANGSPWLLNESNEITLIFAEAPERAVLTIAPEEMHPIAENSYFLLQRGTAFQLPPSSRVIVIASSTGALVEFQEPPKTPSGKLLKSGRLPDLASLDSTQKMTHIPAPDGLTIYANMVRAGCSFRNFEMGGSNGAVIHLFNGSASIEGYDWETEFDTGDTFFKAGITPEPGLAAGSQGVTLLDISIDDLEGHEAITYERRSEIFDRYEKAIEQTKGASGPVEAESDEARLTSERLDKIRDEVLGIDEEAEPERAAELVFELMRYLRSGLPEFRLGAAAIFARLGPRLGKYAAQLAGLLEDDDEDVRQAGREILTAAGLDPDEVASSAGDQLRQQQLGMIQVLGGQLKTFASMDMNDEQVAQVTQILSFFGQILRNEDPAIRRESIRQLGNAGPAIAPLAPQYMFLLGDLDASVRKAAMEAFRNMGVEIKLDEKLGPIG